MKIAASFLSLLFAVAVLADSVIYPTGDPLQDVANVRARAATHWDHLLPPVNATAQ